jgi:glycosyltransferase involved in cell wall biosynthesis
MLKFGNKIKSFFILLLLSICWKFPVIAQSMDLPEMPMVILITSYNNRNYLFNNLKSVFAQDYSNYRVIYVDDDSSDGTANEVEHLVKAYRKEDRFTLIRNKLRVGALCNIYHAVHSCDDRKLVVSLDGDDWFPHQNVLKIINTVYSTQNVWLTHGSLIEYPNIITDWSFRFHLT